MVTTSRIKYQTLVKILTVITIVWLIVLTGYIMSAPAAGQETNNTSTQSGVIIVNNTTDTVKVLNANGTTRWSKTYNFTAGEYEPDRILDAKSMGEYYVVGLAQNDTANDTTQTNKYLVYNKTGSNILTLNIPENGQSIKGFKIHEPTSTIMVVYTSNQLDTYANARLHIDGYHVDVENGTYTANFNGNYPLDYSLILDVNQDSIGLVGLDNDKTEIFNIDVDNTNDTSTQVNSTLKPSNFNSGTYVNGKWYMSNQTANKVYSAETQNYLGKYTYSGQIVGGYYMDNKTYLISNVNDSVDIIQSNDTNYTHVQQIQTTNETLQIVNSQVYNGSFYGHIVTLDNGTYADFNHYKLTKTDNTYNLSHVQSNGNYYGDIWVNQYPDTTTTGGGTTTPWYESLSYTVKALLAGLGGLIVLILIRIFTR